MKVPLYGTKKRNLLPRYISECAFVVSIYSDESVIVFQIFETFGPVKFPCYSVLVESINHATSLGLSPGQLVYVVPSNMELTKYIFTKQLMK